MLFPCPWVQIDDQSVDFLDGLRETSHHVLWCHLQFVDEAVDLVDEENRLHFFFQRLTNHGFGLRHGAFNGTGQNETTVNGSHGTGDVATKVNVSRSVDEVDEVIRSFNGVDHRSRGGVDGDTTSRFLLVEVKNASCTCKLVGHHSGTGDEVVREGGLAVVNVSSDAEIPNLRQNVHDFCGFLDVVFFASHGGHRVLVTCAH